MDIETAPKTYCLGCNGGYPRARFLRPEGDRYVHMAGMINLSGDRLNVTIVCTAVQSLFIRETEGITLETLLRAVSKDGDVKLPPESPDKLSVEVKPHFFEEYVNGYNSTAVSLPSGPQRETSLRRGSRQPQDDTDLCGLRGGLD